MKWSRKKSRRRRRKETPGRILFWQIFWGLFSILLVSGLVYGVWYVTHIPSLNINEVNVSGGETINTSVLRTTADQELSGEYFHLIPKRFIWTYPKTRIIEAIKKQDRIKEILLTRDSQTLNITFSEYQPFALWCNSFESKDCLFIDQSGLAFAPAPTMEGSALIRYNDVGRSLELKTQAFSADFIAASLQLSESMSTQFGFKVIQVEKTGIEEVSYYLAGGGEIKVSTRLGAEDTLANLATILTSQEFLHLKPGNFQYIDLRYGDKIFVNENLETSAETSAVTSTSSADVVEDTTQ